MTDPLFLFTLAAAFLAGLVRGFSGFGGPAFMLASLTWVYTPMQVIGKVLIIELVSSGFLMWKARGSIDWKSVAAIAIPTVLTMPVGYQYLTQTEPELMRRVIALITLFCSVLMLLRWRYRAPLTMTQSIILGLAGGVVFGASYIALLIVAVVLLGPQGREHTRSLIIAWGFITALAYLFLSGFHGNTGWHDVTDVLPVGLSYFVGAWAGASLFGKSNESSYRHTALLILIVLSAIGLIHST